MAGERAFTRRSRRCGSLIQWSEALLPPVKSRINPRLTLA
ncbi:hypothetical protein HMPREF9565_01818 [Cutibacterium acnes HL053PA2]|nr:hypothetical protein HMPREF9567_01211 [Cutibacterium acnes HL013PA1]EFS60493.1 hypothetical protein HMPREF9605_01883 [Cutibacterium acnes HL036PA2]EFS81918.1 hypothetical protein HMPREF9598_01341 [Cutibacterium acnes HL050PA1]EFT11524.1 hypothetical protein HMPREF9620_02261 [Cutibacterium acnes HL037PA1]EFT32123.1 hypothetical protein HMPREF9595_00496 [Cutibacterium acnes HL005PA2]EFT49977.1 hypothetical protein HMPREF9565_01818 [Cutibacterium acnes HL053PA2]EGE92487.1 hypothetical protein